MQEYLPKALPVNISDASLVRIERGSSAGMKYGFLPELSLEQRTIGGDSGLPISGGMIR
jgi:hypothetical protein